MPDDIKILSELAKDFSHSLVPNGDTQPTATALPPAVERFCADIGKNFSTTAERLEKTAEAMRTIADDFLARAKELRDAGPDMSKQVEDWIRYERESNEREKFYASLFSK